MSTAPDLSRLLRPKSIAVFGGVWAEHVVEQCAKMNFSGDVWPVHPRRAQMAGKECFKSIADLPGAPDAAFIAVNRHAAIGTTEALNNVGAGGAICFASGFAESGPKGAALQDQLVKAAGRMPILGPNCYGLINYLDKTPLWPDQHGGRHRDRGVAILTQSGNIGINLTVNRRAVPIAYLGTLGNQAQIGLAELTVALAADDRVTAIGVYLEGLNDAEAFAAAVETAHANNVAIVVLKAGRSSKGAEIALSHTGSLAGSDAVMDAYFERLGVASVRSIPQLLETLKLLHVHGPLPGKTMVTMSCSGGEALLTSDAVETMDLDFRPFSEGEKNRIKATTHDLVTVDNPFDYHTFDWGDWERSQATYAAVMECGYDLTGLVLDFPRDDRCDPKDWTDAAAAFTRATQATGARTAIISTLPELLPEAVCEDLLNAGIAPLNGLDDALAAVVAAASIRRREPIHGCFRLPPARGHEPVALTEWEAKERLREAGVPVPVGFLCALPEEAIAAAAQLGGPVAAKAVAWNLLHKSERNAVRLNLIDPTDVSAAFISLRRLGEAVLIETMAAPAVADLIVGIRRDPIVGFYLMIGSGGTAAELIRDTKIALLPSTEEEIRRLILGLKLAPLLTGYRGGTPGDLDAAVTTVANLQAYVMEQSVTLEELEINPLIVHENGKGVTAVDALIRVREVNSPNG